MIQSNEKITTFASLYLIVIIDYKAKIMLNKGGVKKVMEEKKWVKVLRVIGKVLSYVATAIAGIVGGSNFF